MDESMMPIVLHLPCRQIWGSQGLRVRVASVSEIERRHCA